MVGGRDPLEGFKHDKVFPLYPSDHPIWRDLNFCPREVYDTLIKPMVEGGPPGEGASMKAAVASATGKKGKVSKLPDAPGTSTASPNIAQPKE